MKINDYKFEDEDVDKVTVFEDYIAISSLCYCVGYVEEDVNAMAEHFKIDKLSVLNSLVEEFRKTGEDMFDIVGRRIFELENKT